MINGIDDAKTLEVYNKLRSIRKKIKNKEILKNLIEIANLPCVEGIYLQSTTFVILYSTKNINNYEIENKAIKVANEKIKNNSRGMYTLSIYSVEEYVDPIYFFPSKRYFMNRTIDSGVALFESEAILKLKKAK